MRHLLGTAVAAAGILAGLTMISDSRAEPPSNHPGIDERRIGDCPWAYTVEGTDAEHPIADDHWIYGALTQEKCESFQKEGAECRGGLVGCPRLLEDSRGVQR